MTNSYEEQVMIDKVIQDSDSVTFPTDKTVSIYVESKGKKWECGYWTTVNQHFLRGKTTYKKFKTDLGFNEYLYYYNEKIDLMQRYIIHQD